MTNTLSTRERRVSRLNRKGFTLIELIVVIAILAILAAIAIPAFTGQLDNAKKKSYNSNIAVLRSAAQIALAENGNPTAAVTWTSATTTPADARYAASKYIDIWPTNPMNVAPTAGQYQVNISLTGVVTISAVGSATPLPTYP